MTYRDTDVTKLKTEVQHLQESNDHLVDEIALLQKNNNELREQIPSGLHKGMRVILNAVIVFLLGFLAVGSSYALGLVINYGIQQRVQSSQEHEIQRHPQVHRINFGEEVRLQHTQDYNTQDNERVFYAFHQTQDSFVEFEMDLSSPEPTTNVVILEIYRYGSSVPLYSQESVTGIYAFYLIQGDYRYRVIHNGSRSNPPQIATTTVIRRLQREPSP